MLHEYLTRSTRDSKVHYQQYLYNSGEPRDFISRDTLPSLDDDLPGDSHIMRQQFRRIAQRMRSNNQ
jgi:hypothetical protein